MFKSLVTSGVLSLAFFKMEPEPRPMMSFECLKSCKLLSKFEGVILNVKRSKF